MADPTVARGRDRRLLVVRFEACGCSRRAYGRLSVARRAARLGLIAMAGSLPIDKTDSEHKPAAQRTGPEMPRPDAPTGAAPAQPKDPAKPWSAVSARIPGIIVGLIAAAVAGLSIWYLVRPEPCWCRARWMPRASTSPRGSMAALRISRSCAARTSPPAPCWCASTTPRRWQSTSRRWPPRSSPRRSSPTSMPARERK